MCDFCDNLNWMKKYAMEENKGRNEENKLRYAYNVALVQHIWTKRNGKRNAGRSTNYRNRGIGYQLNYCPECGSSLRRGNEIKRAGNKGT